MALELTFRELLPRLEAEGLADAAAVEGALAAQGGATPWFVRVLVGFGAWVAAAFLIGFGGAAVFRISDGALLALGLACCAAALLLRRAREGVFVEQLALAVALAGQGLVIGASTQLTDSARWGAAATVAVAVAMLRLYPDRVQAFLSTSGGVLAGLYLVRELRQPLAADGALLAVAVLTHAALLGKVRLSGGVLGVRTAAALAGLVTALLLALLLRSQADVYRALFDAAPHPARSALLTVGLGLLLLFTVVSVLREQGGESAREALVLAGAAVALLALLTLQTPGILGAAGVMALAFHRRSPVLVGVALGFALLAGTAHYYDLSLTLLQKSGALAGSGLLLLALRPLLLRRFPEEAP